MTSRTKEFILSCGESIIQRSKPADGLQSIEDVIQLQITLEQALGAVRSLRNEFSPINRLPAEVICHIFDLVCTWDRDNCSYVDARRVTTLAQVCGQWRSNVISTPFLWSTIHISRKTKPEFITLCFERSKDVPLEIILEMRGGLITLPGLPAYPSTMTPSIDLLAANSGRVQRFSFQFEHEFPNRQPGQDSLGYVPSEEIFKKFLPPGLVSLKWEAGVRITAITRGSGSTIHLPESFVETSLSNLRSLSLRNTFTGPIHGVKNLTNFHLTYTGGLSGGITVWRLHEFLSGNTSLECIHLERCPLIPDPERATPATPVTLRCLTTLELNEVDVPMFFRVVSVPSLGTITSVHLDPLASIMRVLSCDRLVDINTSPSAWDTIRTSMDVEIDFFHIQGDAPPAFGFGQQPWRSLLHKAPTFRTLQIAGSIQGYKEALVLSLSSEPDRFANLETLRLDASSNISSTAFRGIAEVAESRAKRGRSLAKVEYSDVREAPVIEQWKELYDKHRIQDHLVCQIGS